jgi:hypothetical protein
MPPSFSASTLLPGRGEHISGDADPGTRNYGSQRTRFKALVGVHKIRPARRDEGARTKVAGSIPARPIDDLPAKYAWPVGRTARRKQA